MHLTRQSDVLDVLGYTHGNYLLLVDEKTGIARIYMSHDRVFTDTVNARVARRLIDKRLVEFVGVDRQGPDWIWRKYRKADRKPANA